MKLADRSDDNSNNKVAFFIGKGAERSINGYFRHESSLCKFRFYKRRNICGIERRQGTKQKVL